MAPIIYAITNNKGGVGKTHTAFHLAGAYAERGQRVLAIDLDGQMNLTRLFLDPPYEPNVIDVLVNDVPLAQTIKPARIEGISVIPSARTMDALNAHLASHTDAPIRLRDALDEFLRTEPDRFDYIFIDCPPSLSTATQNALAAAHRVIVPIEADKFSVDGLDELLRQIAGTKRLTNPQLEVAGILVSLFKGVRKIERAFDQLLRDKGHPLFQTRINDSTKYREAITARQPITVYLAKSDQADAFRQLINELEHTYVRQD